MKNEFAISSIKTCVYKIPTDLPESDGTFAWNDTAPVLVSIVANNKTGIGFSYGHEAMSTVIQKTFGPLLKHADPMAIGLQWEKMLDASLNIGSRGIVANAIAGVEIALCDLKAKLLQVPLYSLWGQVRTSVPIIKNLPRAKSHKIDLMARINTNE